MACLRSAFHRFQFSTQSFNPFVVEEHDTQSAVARSTNNFEEHQFVFFPLCADNVTATHSPYKEGNIIYLITVCFEWLRPKPFYVDWWIAICIFG